MLHNIFLIAGLFILIGGFVSWYQTRNFLAKSVKTKGVVVSYDYQTSSDDDEKTTSSFPIFNFKHKTTGIEYTVRSNVSGILEKGQDIEILYDPENPENAKINKLSHTWMIPIAVTFMGVFFSFFGVLARINVNTKITLLDQIILVLLTIVTIFTLVKYVKIKSQT